jgi:hypothetical protein
MVYGVGRFFIASHDCSRALNIRAAPLQAMADLLEIFPE